MPGRASGEIGSDRERLISIKSPSTINGTKDGKEILSWNACFCCNSWAEPRVINRPSAAESMFTGLIRKNLINLKAIGLKGRRTERDANCQIIYSVGAW